MTTQNRKTVSLVLGSGGARGLAHIGVIHWLEEHDYKIESVSGCSMGALIGGAYAAGKLDEYEKWVRSIRKVDIFKLLDLSWGTNGFFKGERLMRALTDLVGDHLIEDLPMAYTAVAADVSSEKEIWIRSGKLSDAIRASIAMPLFFTPFDYHGTEVIDGGVLNPVPVAPTFTDRTDMTIAVNLVGPVDHQASSADPEAAKPQSADSPAVLGRLAGALRQLTARTAGWDWSVYDIASDALDAMQSTIARHRLADYPPDSTIVIARNACGTMEFDRATEMIELGYEKARECLGRTARNS